MKDDTSECMYILHTVHRPAESIQNDSATTLYIYTHINRDIYSVNELNMETDFSTSLRKYYSISVS